MRTLLVAALLTASTAHAETYICERKILTGVLPNNFDLIDMNNITASTFVVTRNADDLLHFQRADGSHLTLCPITDSKLDNELTCRTTDKDFRLDKKSGRYIETDIETTMVTQFLDYLPTVESGQCHLFK